MADSEERRTALAQAIVQYLEEHPDAADSMVGIRQWWLPASFLNLSDTEVRETLESLVQGRIVNRTRLADGTEMYSRARRSERH